MGRAYQNRKEPMAKTSDMKAKVYSRYRLIPRQPDCGQLLWLHTACHPPFSQMTLPVVPLGQSLVQGNFTGDICNDA